jgi:Rod binding domain-containing protein
MSGAISAMPSSAEATFSAMQLQKESKIDDTLNLKTLKNREDIQAAAREFEAVFIAEMVKPMFEGLETDTMFGGGKGEEIFRGMMIEQYGKAIAARDITGIQSQVASKLIEIQAQAQQTQ